MKRKSTFKYVYWVLLVVMVLILIPVVSMFLDKVSGLQFKLLMLLPIFIFLPAYVLIVSRFVYSDAAKRGMDPWLWMTVAVFVPNLIGLIIYLIVRQSVKNACIKCGKGIQKEFKICPYCGQNQEILCENCKKAVAPDWSTCPYCAHPLPGKKSQD